jgi:glycosyltransferase involved in cell wall biosynthesis
VNIAHFASAYYPSHGGVQEFVRQLAGQQRLDGDSPLIVTNRWPKSLPAAEIYENVPVRRLVFRVPELNWRQFSSAAIWGPLTLRKILRILRTHGAEAIHIQCVSSNAWYALQVRRYLKLPLVATLHGELTIDSGGLFQRSRFAQDLLRKVLRSADAITACSADTLHEAEVFYGGSLAERGQVIYNGVRAEEFAGVEPYPLPHPYILAIGRNVRQKGFDLLLHSFLKVRRAGFTTHHLLIAGDGPEHESLKRLAAKLHLVDCIQFLGATNRATTARLFAGCSFFVLPSRMEPLGIVNLEAMAAGKAVLATNVGGVPEIVQNECTGILVPPGDIEALARAIGRLLSNPQLCVQLGAAGLERVQCFNWRGVAEQYRSIYHALKRKPTASPTPANFSRL